ncbi:uncharacterized protein UHOD_01996 [Ustilago sp. UG-2017b]|nr:uncharacterized protein UHOD_01996 [Ustilago sp. UG-2017b]
MSHRRSGSTAAPTSDLPGLRISSQGEIVVAKALSELQKRKSRRRSVSEESQDMTAAIESRVSSESRAKKARSSSAARVKTASQQPRLSQAAFVHPYHSRFALLASRAPLSRQTQHRS